MGNDRLFESDPLFKKLESEIMDKKTGIRNLLEEHRKHFDNTESFIKTNFKSLDDEITGLELGELVVLTGMPGAGTTSFGLSIVRNIAIESKTNIPSLIVSLDKNRKELLDLIIRQKRIFFELRQPSYNLAGLEKIMESPLYILYPSNNINIIIDNINRYIDLKGVKLIFIDPLDYIDSSALSTLDRDAEYATILEKLNYLAMIKRVVIMITSNRNKTGITNQDNYRNPSSDGLQNTILEMNHAPTVLFVHRPEYFDILKDEEGNDLTGVAVIFILKSSHYIQGKKARLKFVGNLKSFEELDTPSS